MILESSGKAAFKGYEKPLSSLEKAFNYAGLDVRFEAFTDFGNKYVRVTGGKQKLLLLCIEGACPAQAVKDIAEEVDV